MYKLCFLYWSFSFLDNDGLPVSSRCKSIWKGKFQTGWCLIPFLELPLTHKMSHKIIQRNHNFSMQHIQSNELGHTYNKFTAMVILMTHLMALMLVTSKCWCRLGLHIGNQYNIENISNRSPTLTVSNMRHQQTVTNTRHQHQNFRYWLWYFHLAVEWPLPNWTIDGRFSSLAVWEYGFVPILCSKYCLLVILNPVCYQKL